MTETTIPLPEPPTEKRKPGRPRKVAAPLESVGGIPPTPLPGESTLPPSALQPEGSRQRTRMGRKRLRFTKLPRPAYPVRALWDLATPEEKQKAHERCVLILEWWLGKKTRLEVSSRLALPPLRVWQLGQQALSGMLAGLLRQPKTRPRPGERPFDPPRMDSTALQKEIAKLKVRLKVADEVNSVLRELRTTVEGTRKPRQERSTKRQPKSKTKTPTPDLAPAPA